MIGAGVFPQPTSVRFPDSYKHFSVQDLPSRPLQNPTPARHNGSAAQLFTILSYSLLSVLLQNDVHPGRLLLEPSKPGSCLHYSHSPALYTYLALSNVKHLLDVDQESPRFPSMRGMS